METIGCPHSQVDGVKSVLEEAAGLDTKEDGDLRGRESGQWMNIPVESANKEDMSGDNGARVALMEAASLKPVHG